MRWLVMVLVLVFAAPAVHADAKIVKLREPAPKSTTKPVAKKPVAKKPVRAAKRKPVAKKRVVAKKPAAKAKEKQRDEPDDPDRLRPMP